MSKIIQKFYYARYIILTYLIVLISCGYWIYLDNTPLSWDQSGYMSITAQLGWAIKNGEFRQALQVFLHHDDMWGNRPALFMLIGGFIFNLVGPSIKLIVFFSNAFWLGVLAYSTYRLSRLFSINHKTSCIAVFLVLTSPCISILSRDYTVDLPLTAALTLFYYRLFITDYFSKKIVSFIASFIFLALIKEAFALYVVPLLFMILVYLIIGKIDNKKSRIMNYFTASTVSVIILSIFYYHIFEAAYINIMANVGESLGQYYSRGIEKSNINYYLFYIWMLLSSHGLSFLYFIILIYFVLSTKPKINGLSQLLLCSTLFFSIVGLTFVTDVNFRFTAPLIPLVVICFLSFVSQIKHVIFKVIIVVSLGLFQFYSYLYGINLLPKYSIGYLQIWSATELNTSGQKDGYSNKDFYNAVPIIIKNINDNFNISDINLLVGANTTLFNPNIFWSDMNLILNKHPKLYNGSVRLSQTEIESYDVIVIKSKNSSLGCPMCIESEYVKFNNMVSELSREHVFHVFNTYDLYDGSKALVYVKMPRSLKDKNVNR